MEMVESVGLPEEKGKLKKVHFNLERNTVFPSPYKFEELWGPLEKENKLSSFFKRSFSLMEKIHKLKTNSTYNVQKEATPLKMNYRSNSEFFSSPKSCLVKTSLLKHFELPDEKINQKEQIQKIAHLLETVLQEAISKKQNIGTISSNNCKLLLQKESKALKKSLKAIPQGDEILPKKFKTKIGSIPQRPYHKEIAKVLSEWSIKKDFPFRFKRVDGLNDEDEIIRLRVFTLNIVNLFHLEDEKQKTYLRIFLENISFQGLLTMLKLRKTKSSIEQLPPSCCQLICSFNYQEKDSSLSAGAKDLQKKYGGYDEDQNRKANLVLKRLLSKAVWLHLFKASCGSMTYEIRNSAGFGGLWKFDTNLNSWVFIEFVEMLSWKKNSFQKEKA